MTWYLCIKWLHILSSVLLVGTGFGSAFYLYFVHRSGNQQAIAHVIRLVVRADYWFTLPTIVVQPLTGFAMLHLAQQPLRQTWILASVALYAVATACWIAVYFLQLRMHKIASASLDQDLPLTPAYWRYAGYWQMLGYPAFIAMLAIYWLMVFKPA